MATKSTAAERPRAAAEPGRLALVCGLAWLIPGAGHLVVGRRQKGLIFFIALPLMFLTGLWLEGRLFPLELSDPLVFLGAIANRGIGAPFFLAKMFDAVMVLFACFVSLMFAVLLRDDPREQLKTGAMMLGGFVAAAYILGWLMYPLPL